MPDDNPDRREFASNMIDVLSQLPRDDRLALLRAGTVAAVGTELTEVVQSKITEFETNLAGLRGAEAIPQLMRDVLIANTEEQLSGLTGIRDDVAAVSRELAAQPAPSPGTVAPSPSGNCPRCGNPTGGGLCSGCRDHDQFVEDDRRAYDQSLADQDYNRVQDDYLRDQQTYFNNQDTWRDDY